MNKQTIEFSKSKDYTFLDELGQGSTGKTILMRYETIKENFVCKKYETYYPEDKECYYDYFVNEIKILYKINHPNIVRVFSYYLYPEKYTGYIIMEYIDGTSINDYIKNNPNQINSVFEQVINGFRHLEGKKILHRDIRSSNILITNDGIVKIIDFGFGKKSSVEDMTNTKSITLAWICEKPNEFSSEIYNHQTEVYFVGMLFKQMLDLDLQVRLEFKYNQILDLMTKKDPSIRLKLFSHVFNQTTKSKVLEFTTEDKSIYKVFADALFSICAKFYYSTSYRTDLDGITLLLSELIKNTSLEEKLHSPKELINCFVMDYKYLYRNNPIEVVHISDFFKEI